ncbi:MAG: hypothetical protein DRJ51_02795 [Thermoprotei archaeon]|nr:MAG: hypothetical protein DRJ51_02795 [Thermoprotei archaeon]RLF02594.1 MAG: hypothetical protein DRJ59_03205 [Thermoprotei archaeon]
MLRKIVMELLKSGIDGLDKIIGGIPIGSTVLVAGQPGSGKSTFAAQFLYQGLLNGERAMYISLVEDKQRFHAHMEQLGFNFKAFEKRGAYTFLHLPPANYRSVIDALLEVLLDNIKNANPSRLVIDSITALIGFFTSSEARTFVQSLVRGTSPKPISVTSVLVAELPYSRQAIGFGFEEFIADAVIILYTTEKRGLIRRLMKIRKVRWSKLSRISYEFIIGEKGIELYLPQEIGLKGGFLLERVSTGISELDGMLGGGLYKGSTTLIKGPAGAGKTLLAIMFILEGARRGESCVYISFEEPVDQLKTMMRLLGVRDELIEKVRIFSSAPQLFTPATLYHFLENIIEEFKPNRLVIDGMSTLSHSYSREEFLELSKSVIYLSKQYEVTLLMTSLANVVREEGAEISTAADNLITLWFERTNDEVERKISVLKTRGSAHDRRVRRLEIKDGRVMVL